MKAASAITIMCLFALTLATPSLFADSGRVADITDITGTTTSVEGMHYCFEELEGDDLYVNKYDEFFVVRGEATIRVLFKDLALVEFKGKVEEINGKRLRKALIVTRSGKEVEAHIQCHDGCFIKGHVDLGEYRVDLDKIRKMDFLKGKEVVGFKMQILDPEDAPPAGMIHLTLQPDGTIIATGFPGSEEPVTLELDILVSAVKSNMVVSSEFKKGVYLTATEGVSGSLLLKALVATRKAGTRTILYGT